MCTYFILKSSDSTFELVDVRKGPVQSELNVIKLSKSDGITGFQFGN